MGRAPCCSKVGLLRGPWAAKEDALLTDYIKRHGEGSWRSLPKKAGLLRCGKSCRLRWMNYLRPDIKRGNIGPEEEDLIIRLHSLLGNRWSLIAGRLPGRTDNEIKNYWNGHLSKKLKQQGIEIRERSTTKSSSLKRSRRDEKKKKKNKEERGESAKIKIHAPKPTRFAPILSSNDSRETNVASEDEIGDVSRPDGDADQGSPLVEGDFPGNLQNYYRVDCDFEYDLLDRVYQEYSQLLNSGEDQFPFDSFTEALLM